MQPFIDSGIPLDGAVQVEALAGRYEDVQPLVGRERGRILGGALVVAVLPIVSAGAKSSRLFRLVHALLNDQRLWS